MFLTETFDVPDSTQSAAETVKEVAENPALIRNLIADYTPKAIGIALKVIFAIILIVVGLKLIKWLVKVVKKAMERSRLEAGVVSFLSSLIKYALYFVLILLVLAQFGVTTGSVVAVLGSAGLTLGLALQGSLANFAGGVLILLLKPFVVGDYIVSGVEGKEGTVSGISIFYTKLLTIDNKVVQIPNGALSNATVTNVTQMPERMLDMVFNVSYDTNLDKVKTVLNKIVVEEHTILADRDVNIFVKELGESSINMGLRVWVKTEDYWNIKWRLTENVKKAFDENGISIPFPQLDVAIKK